MLAGVAVLAFAGVVAAAPADERAAVLRSRASRHLDAGCPGHAAPLAIEALRLVEQEHGPESAETAAALDLVVEAFLRFRGGADPEVRALAERAVHLKERLHGPWHPELANSLDRFARVRAGAMDSLDPGPMFQRALGIREQAFGPDSLELAATLDAFGRHLNWGAGPDEEDGILTAEEIASLDLSSVQWAVLSACDTGVGEVRNGEGVLGLRRAFRIAGASTLITSLWAVKDEPTRAYMRELYAARLERGLETPESLREAALATLQQRREAGLSTHPFYWAGFVASGNWR